MRDLLPLAVLALALCSRVADAWCDNSHTAACFLAVRAGSPKHINTNARGVKFEDNSGQDFLGRMYAMPQSETEPTNKMFFQVRHNSLPESPATMSLDADGLVTVSSLQVSDAPQPTKEGGLVAPNLTGVAQIRVVGSTSAHLSLLQADHPGDAWTLSQTTDAKSSVFSVSNRDASLLDLEQRPLGGSALTVRTDEVVLAAAKVVHHSPTPGTPLLLDVPGGVSVAGIEMQDSHITGAQSLATTQRIQVGGDATQRSGSPGITVHATEPGAPATIKLVEHVGGGSSAALSSIELSDREELRGWSLQHRQDGHQLWVQSKVDGVESTPIKVVAGAKTNSLVVTELGNLGVGTANPSAKLDVNGGVQGTSSYSSLSDERFKTNVVPLHDDAVTEDQTNMNKVEQLRGVEFEWKRAEFPHKNFPTKRQLGFIAQHVEAVLPQVVNTAPHDGTKSVEYSSIIPVLVEALKEANQRAKRAEKELQDRMIHLEAETNGMKRRLEELERMLIGQSEGR